MYLKYVNLAPIAVLLWVIVVSADTLTLSEAVARGNEYNALLRSQQLKISAAKKRTLQAGKFENPELEAGIEGFQGDEIEVAVTHTIESRGKRTARMAAAAAEVEPLAMEYEVIEAGLVAAIKRAFCTVLSLDDKETAIDSLIISASAIRNATQQQFDAGAAMRIDVLRAEMAVVSLGNEQSSVKREKRKHLLSLKALIGDSSSHLPEVRGVLNHSFSPPTSTECFNALMEHPSQKIYGSRLSLGEARLHRVETEWLPNVSITAGYLRDNERGQNKPVIGAAVVLPFFNRNRPETAALKEELHAVESGAEYDLSIRKSELEQLLLDIVGCEERIGILRDGSVPVSSDIYHELVRMYQNGRVGYIEVTQAQADMLKFRMELIDLRLERILHFIDLEEQSGMSFPVLQ